MKEKEFIPADCSWTREDLISKTDPSKLEQILWKLYTRFGAPEPETKSEKKKSSKPKEPRTKDSALTVHRIKKEEGVEESSDPAPAEDKRVRSASSGAPKKGDFHRLDKSSKSKTALFSRGLHIRGQESAAERKKEAEERELLEWANTYLKEMNMGIPTSRGSSIICLDLRSGVKLIALAEKLTGESVGYSFDETTTKWHMQQNAKQLLALVSKDCAKIPKGISERSIVDGNPTAIFGLLSLLREQYDFEFVFKRFVILIIIT